MPIIQRFVFSLIATAWTFGFGAIAATNESPAKAPTAFTTRTVSNINIKEEKFDINKVDWAEVEFFAQMQDKRTPSVEYWFRVAQCETNFDWADGGKWGGGLGIYTQGKFRDSNMGTWERWGGEEFAPHPSQATWKQQVVIANRIAIFGYRTIVVRPDGGVRQGVPPTYVWERPGIGYNGWGCIKNTVGPPPQAKKKK